MKRNIGSVDRWVRIVLGIAIIVVGVVMKSWWGVIGLLPLVTALVGWCPAYLPFRITTTKRQP
jgi:hypothetical protein